MLRVRRDAFPAGALWSGQPRRLSNVTPTALAGSAFPWADDPFSFCCMRTSADGAAAPTPLLAALPPPAAAVPPLIVSAEIAAAARAPAAQPAAHPLPTATNADTRALSSHEATAHKPSAAGELQRATITAKPEPTDAQHNISTWPPPPPQPTAATPPAGRYAAEPLMLPMPYGAYYAPTAWPQLQAGAAGAQPSHAFYWAPGPLQQHLGLGFPLGPAPQHGAQLPAPPGYHWVLPQQLYHAPPLPASAGSYAGRPGGAPAANTRLPSESSSTQYGSDGAGAAAQAGRRGGGADEDEPHAALTAVRTRPA